MSMCDIKQSDVHPGLGFLVLLLGVSSTSAQCSTCVSGKCYDNGECIIGCIPGYVGRFCDKPCPPNCINNVCHKDIIKGVITCSDGCTPGRCGAQCSLACPPGCVTCDRQCNTCNVTLCPEGRYGADCSQTCDPNYEKCDRESGECIRCRRGYYGDSCDQNCTTCFTTVQDIAYKCLSGCERCKSQESCPPGSYGDKCHLKCSRNCGQLERTGEPCKKATRECTTGCKAGYHGRTCNYTCSELCVAGVCQQHGGSCKYGCISGFKIRQGLCERINDEDTSIDLSVVLYFVVAYVVALPLVVVIGWMINRRRCRRRGHAAGPTKLLSAEKVQNMANSGNITCEGYMCRSCRIHLPSNNQTLGDQLTTLLEEEHRLCSDQHGERESTTQIHFTPEYLSS